MRVIERLVASTLLLAAPTFPIYAVHASSVGHEQDISTVLMDAATVESLSSKSMTSESDTAKNHVRRRRVFARQERVAKGAKGSESNSKGPKKSKFPKADCPKKSKGPTNPSMKKSRAPKKSKCPSGDTAIPTTSPTMTFRPTSGPTSDPTSIPTVSPTSPPTNEPTGMPTGMPTGPVCSVGRRLLCRNPGGNNCARMYPNDELAVWTLELTNEAPVGNNMILNELLTIQGMNFTFSAFMPSNPIPPGGVSEANLTIPPGTFMPRLFGTPLTLFYDAIQTMTGENCGEDITRDIRIRDT